VNPPSPAGTAARPRTPAGRGGLRVCAHLMQLNEEGIPGRTTLVIAETALRISEAVAWSEGIAYSLRYTRSSSPPAGWLPTARAAPRWARRGRGKGGQTQLMSGRRAPAPHILESPFN